MRFRLITDLEREACADLQDRALHYGDGLFETLLIKNKRPLYWDGHYRRLAQDAARLGIPCPDESELLDAIAPYRDLGKPLVLKLILSRGAGARGGRWIDDPEPILHLLHYDYSPSKQPLAVTFSTHSLPENPPLAGIKHLNRLDYILASRYLAGQDEFEQLLLCDRQGRVIETLVHNLFLVRNGEVRTPALVRCGVNGVMREQVIKTLEQIGKAVRIDDCSRDDLLAADEAFVCNSVQGIRALTRLDDRRWPVGPLTRTLQETFDEH